MIWHTILSLACPARGRARHGAAVRRGFAVAAVIAGTLLALQPSQAAARYAAIVMDAASGKVLHAANADTRNYPASLTKMMTLYMAFEALDEGRLALNQRLPVSKRAQGMTPSKLYLRVGQTIRVKDAMLALVTKSANDAATVLAEAMGGTEWQFAQKMTAKARAIGMHRTTFRNASGLPNRHQLSTARDMATLSRRLIYDYPHYYHYFSTTRFSYSGRTYGNHNNLLKQYRGTDGIKTGYIRASGFNLAASVVRDGRRLIAVVFGGRTARSRDRHIMQLLDQGFAKARHLPRTVPVVAPPPRKPAHIQRVASASQPAAEPAPVGSRASTDGPVPVPPSRDGAGQDPLAATVSRVVDGLPVPGDGRPAEVRVAAREAASAVGAYAVQVGAYRAAAPAHLAAVRAANRIPDVLGTSEVSVSRIRGDRGPLYRARLVGLSRPLATHACRQLVARGVDCLVIRPRGGVEVAFNAR